MPLELYLRGKTWWFRGQIDELPKSHYYRQSTGKTDNKHALSYIAEIRNSAIRDYYSGGDKSFTFAEAVTLYNPTKEFAGYLMKVMPYLEHLEVTNINAKMVRNLGPIISPDNATDTWRKQIICPVMAVINAAHDEGRCPAIKIKGYSDAERQRQDEKRGKASRVKKVPGTWEWVYSLRAVADPYTGLLCQFMFETGTRIGEAVKLRPADIDIENCCVLLPPAKGHSAEWKTISPELMEELISLKPKTPEHVYLKDLKFETKVFGFAGRNSVYEKWKRYCALADIPVFMPHAACRHGFATEMLVRNKVDPHSVAEAGRWADVGLLFRTYGHAENATDKIQQALRTNRVQAQANFKAKTLIKKDK